MKLVRCSCSPLATLRCSRKSFALFTPLLSLPLVFAACSSNPDGSGKGLAIELAALDLPGVTDVCYDIWVTNGPDGTGDLVWRQDDVCTTRFGNGLGDITYIGTCDAQGPGTSSPSHRINSVSISIVDLWTSGSFESAPYNTVDHDTYQNPCGTEDAANNDGFGPCVKSVDCVENTDTLVRFDITILRDATQGFFDVAVDFEDVFCSAKLDCAGGNLLFAADGERHETAVIGFACSAGAATRPGGGETHLYMNDIVVSCDDDSSWTLSPAVHDLGDNGGGNQMTPPGAVGDADGNPIFQWAVYAGTEPLGVNADPPFTKAYWNVAIGFDVADLAGRDCRIKASATVSDGALSDPQPGYTPPATTYPVIVWDAALNGDGLAALTCGSNALDAATSGGPVRTTYTASSVCFDNHGSPVAGDLATVENTCPECVGFPCAGSCCPYGNLCTDGVCVAPPATCISYATAVRDGGVCVTSPCPKTCLEVRDAVVNAQSGTYLIDPDGVGGNAAFPARCDMDYDGGGWTLIGHERAGSPSTYTTFEWLVGGTLQFLASDTNNADLLASGAEDGIIGVRFPYGTTYGSARFNWCDPGPADNLFARFDTPEHLFADTRRDCLASTTDPTAVCATYIPEEERNTIRLTAFQTNDAFLQAQLPDADSARFCRAATTGASGFRPGDTSWALKGPYDGYFECGCNSGGWRGVGTYYGGAELDTQSICLPWGGGFAGSVSHGMQKGAVNRNNLHFWIR